MLLQAHTKYGTVRGCATDVEDVAVFRGIPYAAPPVGENRWRAPQPLLPWDGVRDCCQYSPACFQSVYPPENFYRQEFYEHRFHRYPPDFSEDCLYLNIWTPAGSAEEKLPVMVWIHGGGYKQGYGSEPRSNGEVLAGKGVIVVSFNYRLNIFGFFGHPELAAEQDGHCGNYAIMDQIAALDWVRENIAAFGGDPDNITLFGHSSGSFSVQALSVIPMTKGKVRRAIMQSGALSNVGTYGWRFLSQQMLEDNGQAFMRFTKKVTLSQLRSMPAEELLQAYTCYVQGEGGDFCYPCLDGFVYKKHPADSFAKGEAHIESLIAGATLHETKARPVISNVTMENYKEIISQFPHPDFHLMTLAEVKTDAEAGHLANLMFAWYVNGGTLAMCEHMARVSHKRVYSYSFQRKLPGRDAPGMFHSACIWYAFGNLHNCRRPFTEADFKLEKTMVEYWTNFAKTGDPNSVDLPLWDPYTSQKPYSMILDVDAIHMADITLQEPSFALLRNKLVEKE